MGVIKSSAAKCAQEIRKELKEKYPTVKFKVVSETFSMGNAVRVSWIDGPPENDVEVLIGKWQYGHFDGMQDMYVHSNRNDDLTQVKWVQTTRYYSFKAHKAVVDLINVKYGISIPYTKKWCEYYKRDELEVTDNSYIERMQLYPHQLIYQESVNINFTEQ